MGDGGGQRHTASRWEISFGVAGRGKRKPLLARVWWPVVALCQASTRKEWSGEEFFSTSVRDLLEKGRGKYRNMMIVGPANCGKTFLLQPLNVIYSTFCNPACTSFAWAGAEKAECIFLNDFRWSPQIIQWRDFLLMLEAQTVHLPAPKTRYARDIVFNSDTPIFCTGKHSIIYIKNGVVDERETEMMCVRWKIFNFNFQIPQAEQREVPSCTKCFARLILDEGDDWSVRQAHSRWGR